MSALSFNKNFPSAIKSWKNLLPYLGSSAVIFGAMIAGKAASFLWRMLLLRFDVNFLGEVEVFTTTLGLAVTFSSVALPAALTRFALRDKTKSLSYLAYSFKLLTPLFLMVCLGLWLLTKFGVALTVHNQPALPLLLFVVAILAAQEMALAYLNSQKRFLLYGLGEYLLAPGLRLIFLVGILAGLLPKTLMFPHVIWSLVGGALIINLLALRKKQKQQFPDLMESERRDFSAYTALLSGSFLTFMVYGALDIYLLQYFFGSNLVGVYVGLLTLVNLMDLIFLPFLHTFQAHLADRKNDAAKINFTQKTVALLAKIGLTTGVILALTSAGLLPFLSNYQAVVPFGVILTFTIYKTLHYGLVHTYRHYLDFQGEQRFTAITMTMSLVIKGLLCLWLVPTFSLGGLAVANIVTDLVHAWLLRRRMLPAK